MEALNLICIVVFRRKPPATSFRLVRSIQIYKEIQLLCATYNRIHRLSLIPLLLFSGIVCFCGSLLILVKHFHQLDVIAVMIFLNAATMSTALLLLCFHFPSVLVCSSSRTLKILSNHADAMIHRHGNRSSWSRMKLLETRTLKKCVKCLQPLKIRFLHSSYFDRITPFRFFIFSTQTAIKIIVLY